MEKQKPAIHHSDREILITGVPLRKRRLLIIDDDDEIREMLGIIFERAGYDTEIKSNGDDLVNQEFELPHLFLIDKHLRSKMTGLDVCRYLKDQEHTRNIPVILLSAAPDIRTVAREAGANAYIEKPFEIAYLLKLVNYYTRQKNTSETYHSF